MVNDEKVKYRELVKLFLKMSLPEDSDACRIFNYNLRSKKQEKRAIKHSTYVTARDKNDHLIGLVRIIGDSTYEHYISEVMVIPEFQNQGIGKKLIKSTLNYCKENGFIKIFLTAAKGRESYYSKFGFKVTKYNVMKITSENKEIGLNEK